MWKGRRDFERIVREEVDEPRKRQAREFDKRVRARAQQQRDAAKGKGGKR